MKNSKAKQQASRFNRHTAGIIVLILLIGCCFVAQVAFNKIIWQSLNRQNNLDLRRLITDAINNLSKEAVIDGPSRKVYLPEAKLVLPPYPIDLNGLRYRYSPAQDEANFKAEIYITTNETLRYGISQIPSSDETEQIFESLPSAQACSRQILLAFEDIHGKPDHQNVKVSSIKLADGRTAYLYLDNGCKDNSEALINYLQQLQSY